MYFSGIPCKNDESKESPHQEEETGTKDARESWTLIELSAGKQFENSPV